MKQYPMEDFIHFMKRKVVEVKLSQDELKQLRSESQRRAERTEQIEKAILQLIGDNAALIVLFNEWKNCKAAEHEIYEIREQGGDNMIPF